MDLSAGRLFTLAWVPPSSTAVSDGSADPALLAVVEKAVKQRRDSVEQFTKGGREDLANNEQAEIDILQAYLPEQLGQADNVHVVVVIEVAPPPIIF